MHMLLAFANTHSILCLLHPLPHLQHLASHQVLYILCIPVWSNYAWYWTSFDNNLKPPVTPSIGNKCGSVDVLWRKESSLIMVGDYISYIRKPAKDIGGRLVYKRENLFMQLHHKLLFFQWNIIADRFVISTFSPCLPRDNRQRYTWLYPDSRLKGVKCVWLCGWIKARLGSVWSGLLYSRSAWQLSGCSVQSTRGVRAAGKSASECWKPSQSKDLEDEEFIVRKAGFLSGETKTLPTSPQNPGHAN